MTYEYSCGAVVYTRVNGEPRYLLIREKAGHWGFPKGHMEAGETERETALREIREETGVRVALQEGFQAVTEYDLHDLVDTRKRVTFFLAEFADQELTVQESEVADFALVSFGEAMALIQFADSRQILTDAHAFLTR